jgi:hypothetical protein
MRKAESLLIKCWHKEPRPVTWTGGCCNKGERGKLCRHFMLPAHMLRCRILLCTHQHLCCST